MPRIPSIVHVQQIVNIGGQNNVANCVLTQDGGTFAEESEEIDTCDAQHVH